jgi:asparagine synthase (glutamine-hydrolysing)
VDDTLYYGYEQDLLNKVKENFRNLNVNFEEENIHFVKGLYQNTLRIEEDVAFAHIDADWYDSVMTCLQEIEPHLVPGSVLVIDDYYDWQGCKKAVDTYFKDKDDDYYFLKKSRLQIIRK